MHFWGTIYIADADNSLCNGEDKYHLEQIKKKQAI